MWRDFAPACNLSLIASDVTLPKAVTQTSSAVVKQVVFLTVDHRGPLPSRELHPTDETRVWRDPGDIEPVSDLFPITGEFILSNDVTQTNGVAVKQVVSLTVDHRGPLPSRELLPTDETRVWRDPGGS